MKMNRFQIPSAEKQVEKEKDKAAPESNKKQNPAKEKK